MLKPSKGLREMWENECKSKCASYWWIAKAIPVGRYERCYSKCMREKYDSEMVEKLPRLVFKRTSNNDKCL